MKCCARLRGVFMGDCGRTATVEREGKPFCWQHDPERIRGIAKVRWEARKKEIAEQEEAFDRRIERLRLEEKAGVKSITDDDLRRLIALGGLRAVLTAMESR